MQTGKPTTMDHKAFLLTVLLALRDMQERETHDRAPQ